LIDITVLNYAEKRFVHPAIGIESVTPPGNLFLRLNVGSPFISQVDLYVRFSTRADQ